MLSRCASKAMYLEKSKRLSMWNGGSIFFRKIHIQAIPPLKPIKGQSCLFLIVLWPKMFGFIVRVCCRTPLALGPVIHQKQLQSMKIYPNGLAPQNLDSPKPLDLGTTFTILVELLGTKFTILVELLNRCSTKLSLLELGKITHHCHSLHKDTGSFLFSSSFAIVAALTSTAVRTLPL